MRTNQHTNTVYEKKSDLDQFYTSKEVAALCYKQIWQLYNKKDFSLLVEPSAGTGSFFNLFPKSKRMGLDLEPKNDQIVKQDFFEFSCPDTHKKVITIGNPPFGRICSLAIRFFNHAAEFSSVIAFIIPKTFRKASLQNKLNLNFRLKLDVDVPKDAFVLNGEPYDVPCCFQIWERSNSPRVIKVVDLNNEYFTFTDQAHADMAIRRVGGRSGKATTKKIDDLSSTCHYFLKYHHTHTSIKDFVDTFNKINFSSIVNSTAGVRSLSKPELIETLKSQFPST